MSSKFIIRIAGVSVLALLLSTAAFAQNTVYRGDRLSAQGIITSISREGDFYRITLNHGGYEYLVPLGTAGSRGLPGRESVRLSGFLSGGGVNPHLISLRRGEPAYTKDPAAPAGPLGST